ncbi:methyl-accepting chemotaxis protein [Celerinatantimonas sp. YJH-8]|uniref:methyl-accepting chemotaxis protein n=1 Tax=Celerinatantimonas sp. YJH-8 TaxID=3228714 RepID=UPI0038C3C011
MNTLRRISIRNKFLLVIILAVILPTVIVGGVIQYASKTLVQHRLIDIELPSTLSNISLRVSHETGTLLKASEQLANNKFIQDSFQNGNILPQDEPRLISEFNQLLQQYDLSDVSLVNTESRRSWDQNGFMRQLNQPRDSWYFSFVESNQETNVSMSQADNGDMMMFIDYRKPNGLLVASMAKSVNSMVNLLNGFQIEKSGYVFLADTDGKIQLNRNQSLVNQNLNDLYGDETATLLQKSDFNLIKTQYQGQSVFVATRYIPSMNWFVVAQVPVGEVFADIHHMDMQILLTIVIVAIIFILFGFWLANGVTRPIKMIAARFSELGHGGGDLSQRLTLDGTDEIAQLSQGFNDFVGQIHQSMHEVASTAVQLQTEAEKVSKKAAITHSNSQHQHDQSLQIVAAMNQMGATISEIASSASTASDSADQASVNTEEGRKVVNQAKDVIHNLAQNISKASEQVQRLASRTDDIGSILDVIQNVSDQTNLLALNAAIEAARAGEHGRGFAVVAEEVRNLAQRTADSAGQIQSMIEVLQRDSQQAVQAMQEGQQVTQDGVDASDQAVAVLSEIYEHIQGISDRNRQVATATEEQATTVLNINENIEGMNDINDETTQTADELAQASQQLHELSNRLNALVGHFEL